MRLDRLDHVLGAWMNTLTVAAALLTLAAVPAGAAVVFDNPFDWNNGSCAFSTECGFGQELAAQKFTLSSATTLTSASFTAYDDLKDPLGVNWWIYAVSVKGLPGQPLASGTSVSMTSRDLIGMDGDLTMIKERFDLPSIHLEAGSYYLGFQAITDSFDVYLGSASLFKGAAESYDFGAAWRKNYEGYKGVAVSLSGSVPEPATWALLIVGFGMTGVALRRRRPASAA